jgi:hypothetical protein
MEWNIADPQADRELDLREPEQLPFPHRSKNELLRARPIGAAAEADRRRSPVGTHRPSRSGSP